MINVQNLTKLYRSGKGIKNLSFKVDRGVVFGFLGPNGAGKTTTIRNLLGFLKPDGGTCTVNGLDCWNEADRIQETLGYIPGEIAFIDGLTGTQFLNLIADMRKIKDRFRMKELIDRFQLDPSGIIKKMSKGMKQKLGIITSCMHDPEIMIFDEPSSGLDPLMQNVFYDFVIEEKTKGKTIFMSSHNFEEIDRTCDVAGIIREGELADVKDVKALKEEKRRIFTVTLGSEAEADKITKSDLTIEKTEKNRVRISVQGNTDSFVKTLAKFNVLDLEQHAMTLEEVFMQYYGKDVH